MLKHLDLEFDVKRASETGEIEGYGSTYGVDLGGDQIVPGAFADTLARYAEKGKLPKMLWQHDPSTPIGVWTSMSEDSDGLYVKGRLAVNTGKGREVYDLLKMGAVDAMSIGYRTIRAEYGGPNANVRMLKELELYEVSLVTFPMNPEAEVTGVKRLDSPGDVERILRDAGVPNTFAKLVASHGYHEAKQRLDGQREAAGNVDQDAIERLLNAIRA